MLDVARHGGQHANALVTMSHLLAGVGKSVVRKIRLLSQCIIATRRCSTTSDLRACCDGESDDRAE